MARYQNLAQAEADGFSIEHETSQHRFVLRRDGATVGEAHYTISEHPPASGGPAIDFDHTFVSPELRGTGLSALLAERALRSEIVHGRRILASCWFIAGYLERHPAPIT